MKDYAIEEIRERRRQLLKEKYGGSISRMIDAAVKWQVAHPDSMVDLHKRTGSKACAA